MSHFSTFRPFGATVLQLCRTQIATASVGGDDCALGAFRQQSESRVVCGVLVPTAVTALQQDRGERCAGVAARRTPKPMPYKDFEPRPGDGDFESTGGALPVARVTSTASHPLIMREVQS